MRIALLEDDQQEKEEFISALQGWDPTRNAECYNSIGDLIAAAKKEPYFSIAFLDVYLPKENGMDAARHFACDRSVFDECSALSGQDDYDRQASRCIRSDQEEAECQTRAAAEDRKELADDLSGGYCLYQQ